MEDKIKQHVIMLIAGVLLCIFSINILGFKAIIALSNSVSVGTAIIIGLIGVILGVYSYMQWEVENQIIENQTATKKSEDKT
ncbi:MAG: hypothetical protein KAS32_26315 [Candidatus Peribacteraceae bacterium]|nr:hypothetical protein [Candidatus Peribacteraceae bacterium]